MRQFKDGSPIALKDHLAWLERTLASDKVRLFVADDQERGLAVGTARLDLVKLRREEWAEVSVTVEPRARGLNYGTQLVEALVELGGVWPPGGGLVAGYVAKIKPDNHASLRAFAACEFIPVTFAEDLVTLERPF